MIFNKPWWMSFSGGVVFYLVNSGMSFFTFLAMNFFQADRILLFIHGLCERMLLLGSEARTSGLILIAVWFVLNIPLSVLVLRSVLSAARREIAQGMGAAQQQRPQAEAAPLNIAPGMGVST